MTILSRTSRSDPVERARVSEMEAEIRRLRMENEFLKKAAAFFARTHAVAERCALIEAEKANYPMAWMCRLLRVPRSSFYAWRNRVETPTAARRRELAEQVRAGVRRLAADLGLPAGRGPAEP